MIHALAEAGAVLEPPDYITAAEQAADFVLAKMTVQPRPMSVAAPRSTLHALRLFRTYNAGRAHLNAYLEDYAAVALGFVALYEATFELRWLEAAAALAQTILVEFRDADGAGFFQVSADHEKLVVRRKDFIDSAIPSGNSLTAELFLRLAVLLGDDAAAVPGPRRGDPAPDGRRHGRAAVGVRPAALRPGPLSQSRPGDRHRRRPGRG